MRDYISKEYSLSIDFLDYSKNKDAEVKSIIYNEKDTDTAFVIAELLANGEPINLNGYDKVIVGIKKSDGLRVQNDCVVLNSTNGEIEIPFTTQSLASVGVNYFDITLYKNKTELVSPKFSYRVMEAMIDDDTLESSNEFGTLVLLIEKTEELLNRTNDACDRVDALEEIVTSNESIRNNNEETRKSNETSRVSAENTRKSNETTRINSENVRISSENTRVSFYNDAVAKENIRAAKENERIDSENTRVSNEISRISEENTRKSNETTRISAENTRKSNETTRVSSEQIRVTNESNRESLFEVLSDNMIDTNIHWDTLFQNRYDNLNQEYAELVDTLDKDVLINNTSESLLNENVTSFKVGTGIAEGVIKDYTSKMDKSLIIVCDLDGNEIYNGVHEPNDIIMLNYSVSCTHKVQLNTKSQVEELQKIVQKEKKDVWETLKELIDVQMHFDTTGYIKFPTLLGGLILQWGVHKFTFNDNYILSDIPYFPVSFNQTCFSVVGSSNNNNFGAYSDINVSCSDIANTRFRLEIKDITQTPRPSDKYCFVNWFAVGR